MERALAFTPVSGGVPFRRNADFVLDCVAAGDLHRLRGRRRPSPSLAGLHSPDAHAGRDDARALLGTRSSRVRALLGSDARTGLLRPDWMGRTPRDGLAV